MGDVLGAPSLLALAVVDGETRDEHPEGEEGDHEHVQVVCKPAHRELEAYHRAQLTPPGRAGTTLVTMPTSAFSLETAFGLGFLLLFLVAFALILRGLWRSGDRREAHRASAVVVAPTDDVASLRCVECGKPATEPSPLLKRGRGSSVRDYFTMPPRYRRVIDREAPLCYCSSHAHVADAELTAFAAVEVDAAFKRAYAEVARKVAAFEQEGLADRVRDSLTDAQKRDRARRSGSSAGAGSASLRVVAPPSPPARNGTDGDG